MRDYLVSGSVSFQVAVSAANDDDVIETAMLRFYDDPRTYIKTEDRFEVEDQGPSVDETRVDEALEKEDTK